MYNGEIVHYIECHRDSKWNCIYVSSCGIKTDERGMPNYWWTLNPELVTCPDCLIHI